MPLSNSKRTPKDSQDSIPRETVAFTPFKSPDCEHSQSAHPTWSRSWRIPFLLAAATIASVPLYGFYVQAARDPQVTAILILLCWLLTWPCAIGSILLAAISPPRSNTVRWFAILLTIYLIVAGFVGWGGVDHAVGELLAG